EASAERFRADHPSTFVGVLEPAVQPALHNPIRPAHLLRTRLRAHVLFDGWWELVEGASEEPLLTAFSDRLRVVGSEWDFGRSRPGDCRTFSGQRIGCVDTLDKAVANGLFGAGAFVPPRLIADWRQQTMMLRSGACGSVI